MAGIYAPGGSQNVTIVGGALGTEADPTFVKVLDENGDEVDWLTEQEVGLPLENQHPTTSWLYTSGATNICVNTTTAVTIKAADASLRNYVDSIQVSHPALGASTILAIRDGAGGTVLWAMQLILTTPLQGFSVRLPPGLIKSTAATLLEIVTLTATVSNGVCVSVQGHVAA
jgi:hypothetical protein